MKLNDVWEGFCFWSRRKRSGVGTFFMQLLVWVVGGIVIGFFTAKESYEKMMKK